MRHGLKRGRLVVSLRGRLREGNEVRGSLILVDLEHRTVQVLWVESRAGNLGQWLRHQHLLGGLELISVRDVGIHTMENLRSRAHALSATS